MKQNTVEDLDETMRQRFKDIGATSVFDHLRLDNTSQFHEALADFDGDRDQLMELIETYNRNRQIHKEQAAGSWESMVAVMKDTEKDKTYKYNKIADFLTTTNSFHTPKHTENIWVFTNPVYRPDGEQVIRQKLQNNLGNHLRTRDINEIIDKIRFRTLADLDKAEQPTHLIPLENGVYNIRSGELQEPDPQYFLTNEIPVMYREDADCPKIKQFLHDLVAEEDVPVLQELIGYCLYRDYPIAKAFMLLGKGKNGKSTFLNLLETFLGAENIANPSLHALVNERFAKKQLHRKLANIHGDLSASKLHETGTFKKLTGQDTIYADVKHGEPFHFTNYGKLIYSANELPATEDTTDAFFRRWLIIRFPYKFTEDPEDGHKNKDPDILQELTTDEELSGLFNWAMHGLRRLLDNGHFTRTGHMEEIKKQWLTRTNPLQVFINEHVVVDTEGGYITKEQFYSALKQFCDFYSSEVPSKQKVGKEVKQMITEVTEMRPSVNSSRQNAWGNIRLHVGCQFLPDKVQERMRVGCDHDLDNTDVTDVTPSQSYTQTRTHARTSTQKNSSNNGDICDAALELYPEDEPTDYFEIEAAAEDELEMDGDRFFEIHEKLQERGDVFSPRKGQWKRL